MRSFYWILKLLSQLLIDLRKALLTKNRFWTTNSKKYSEAMKIFNESRHMSFAVESIHVGVSYLWDLFYINYWLCLLKLKQSFFQSIYWKQAYTVYSLSRKLFLRCLKIVLNSLFTSLTNIRRTFWSVENIYWRQAYRV